MGRAASAFRWLGLPGAERLEGNVAVLSPHLDDGVFSLGAAIAACRGSVAMVTVFAGDPDASFPAGEWDSRAGFRTAGEAAAARRREDERACADLGARPVWLPFMDVQYPRDDDERVWAAVADAVEGADVVLLPAFPLLHDDHVRLFELVERNGLPAKSVGRYVEQPYAATWSHRSPEDGWSPLGAGLPHRLAKLRACRRYVSQLPLLRRSGRILYPLTRYEAARGGELVRWT